MDDAWRFDGISFFMGTAMTIGLAFVSDGLFDMVDRWRDATADEEPVTLVEEKTASQVIREDAVKYCPNDGRPIGTSHNDYRWISDIWCIENDRLVKYAYEVGDNGAVSVLQRSEYASFSPVDSVPDGVRCQPGDQPHGAQVERSLVELWCSSDSSMYVSIFAQSNDACERYVELSRIDWPTDFEAI